MSARARLGVGGWPAYAAARRCLAALALLVVAAGTTCWGQAYTSQAAGPWNTTTTWSPNGTPGAGDTVSIGHNITLAQAQSIDGITFTGSNSISGAFTLTLGGSATITVNSGGTGSITTTVIGGTAGLTKAGAGTLALSALNAYSGTTTVSAGTLTISGASGSIKSSAQVTVAYGATLNVDSTSTSGDRFADTGTIAMQGGTFSWTGAAAAVTETIATLQFSAQHSVLAFTGNSGTNTITLTATNALSRQNSATMELRRSNAFLKSGDANGAILRWTSVDNVAANTYFFVGVGDTTNGLVESPTHSGTLYVGATVDGIGYNMNVNSSWTPNTGFPHAGDSCAIRCGYYQANGVDYSFRSIYYNGVGFSNQGQTFTIDGNIYTLSQSSGYPITTNAWNFSSGEAVFITTTSGPTSWFFNFSNGGVASATQVTKSGNATMLLGAQNIAQAWTTPIVVVQGTLQCNQVNTPLAASSGVTVYNGGALDLHGYSPGSIPLTLNGTGFAGASPTGALLDNSTTACTHAGAITLGSDSVIEVASGGSLTISGAIGGGFSITKTDPGMLVLSNTGNNWSGGSLTISDGALRVSGGTAIPDACAVTTANLATASLDLNGANETIGSLTGGGALGGNVTLGAGTLTVGGATSTSFDGQLTGSGGLTRSGTGTLTLTRASPSFTGALAASGGELDVNASYGAGTVSLTGSGIIGGTGVVGAITSAAGCSGAIIRPGTPGAKGTLQGGSMNLGTGTTPTVSLRVAAFTTAGTDYDKLDLATASGTLACGGSSKLTIDLTGCSSAGVATGAITCSGFPGVFTTVAVTNAPAGYTAYPRYTTGRVDIVVCSGVTVWTNGAASGIWSASGNWSSGLPDATHVALFNATSTANCSIDASATPSCLGIDVDSGYSGTITQSSGKTVALGANGFVQNAGTFDLGGAVTDQLVTPFFDQGGGTFGGSGTVMLVASSSQGFTAVSTLPNLTVEATTEYGLVGYWKMDGSGGTESDASGRGHTATAVNSALSSSSHPTMAFYDPASRTCDVNAPRKYFTVAGHSDFSLTGGWTIALWTHVVDNGSQNDLIRYSSDLATNGFRFSIGTSPNFGPYMQVYNGASSTQVGLPTVTESPATWTHLAYTFDGTTVTAYKNGSAFNPTTFTAGMGAPATSTTMFIGGSGDANTSAGELDDVRIYNRGLSAAEISAVVSGYYGPGRGASVTTTLGRALAVGGDLVVVSGALDVSTSNYAMSVGKNLRLYGDFVARSGTVTLTGTASSTLHGGGNRFYDLAVASTGAGTWTLDDHLWVDDQLSVSTGTLNVSASNWSVHAGTVAQSGGTITPQSGTIVVDGSTSVNLAISSSIKHLQIADPQEASLVAYWPLDEGSGTSARDRSGSGVTGTLANGATWTTSVPAAIQSQDGFALSVDGTDDYVDLGAASALNLAGAFTISAWVKTTDSYGAILSLRLSSTDIPVVDLCVGYDGDDPSISAGAAKLLFRPDGAGANGYAHVTGAAINDGTWHHIAGVRDANGFALLYVDGVLQATSVAAATGSITSDLRGLGAERYWAQTATGTQDEQYLKAQIDDVRVYASALDGPHVRLLAAGKHANAASSTHTLTNALTLAGDMYLIGGTLAANTFGIDVAGSWRNLFGTSAFSAGTGTVTLNGTNQQLYGSTNFFNFTKNVASADTLTFPTFELQGFTGALNLQGASGQLLSIRSASGGSQAEINPTGSRTCNFLSVKDARNVIMPFMILRANATCVNAGNTRWWFESGGGAAGNVLVGAPSVE